MNDLTWQLRDAVWEDDREMLREIRRRVFIEEQQVPQSQEWDGRDETAFHVLALNSDGKVIGTGRLLPTGQVGRMAVLPAWRNRGVGSAMLQRLMETARGTAMPHLFLHAQISALAFYRRHGFVPTGETYMEAGILHQNMEYVENE